nr:hypothetical protein [candidate division Zixibacteria bacterium]
MDNPRDKKRGHAIALFSGGLDSILAILLIMRQNIEVTALTFMSHFGCSLSEHSGCGSDPFPVAEKFAFNVKMVHLGQKFIDIVKSPRYGYGKNMNPCIDCRILMLQETRQFMELVGADFVITGEVLGQRPKSQMRNAMNLVEKKAGLEGLLVRPLCARLMAETIPEKTGLLDRDQLENISGRSRKRQIELATKMGVDNYPESAGGCLLTDRGYSRRLKDLFDHSEKTAIDQINLLRVGRHFRLDPNTKIIVGRNERDNELIRQLAAPHHLSMEALGSGSPITLFIGPYNDRMLKLAAAITARYCDDREKSQIEITCRNETDQFQIIVAPAEHHDIENYQIK